MVEPNLALTKAEENITAISGLVRGICFAYLELGGLLLENQRFAYWSQGGYESFKDFIQILGISYSWATRMMGLADIVAQKFLSEEEIVEIGISKVCLLLPHVKRGEIPEDIKLLARDCTFIDLRRELGHQIPEPSDDGAYVICPRCGGDINPLKVRCPCGQEVTLKRGMIRRR